MKLKNLGKVLEVGMKVMAVIESVKDARVGDGVEVPGYTVKVNGQTWDVEPATARRTR